MIEIHNLGKKYRIGAQREPYLSLRDSVTSKTRHIFNMLLRKEHSIPRQSDFWALRGISFNVNEGEAIGIIGRNGAGKSTLLKILSQITPPTEGKITMRGRAASLLEVGTGFHPELSGRENVYLNGAILGMTRKEIQRKFDEIVDFAGVEKFIDTPVKRYSSGMYVRLAFAVAAHLEPEILIVDEVLAVGDAEFQKKCIGKMQNVAKGGRTVLFVSHNMFAIKKLCPRAILLDKGSVLIEGKSLDVISYYQKPDMASYSVKKWNSCDKLLNDNSFRMLEAKVIDCYGCINSDIESDKSFAIEVVYEILRKGETIGATLALYDSSGICVFTTINNIYSNDIIHNIMGIVVAKCYIPGDLLPEGEYSITLLIWKDGYRVIMKEDNVIFVNIRETENSARGNYLGRMEGVIRPRLKWETKFSAK